MLSSFLTGAVTSQVFGGAERSFLIGLPFAVMLAAAALLGALMPARIARPLVLGLTMICLILCGVYRSSLDWRV